MTTIIKIGGNIINNPPLLEAALDYFAGITGPAILVHGGGRKASQVIAEMGRQPLMVEGRRITDAPTLEIVTMVYAGLINKQVVSALQKRGINAIGLSGADGNVIRAVKRPVKDIDYGFAGDVKQVNGNLLDQLLEVGLKPVLCPITHDQQGQLLNTNADTIANETAVALARAGHEVSLLYCFELPGVMLDINAPTSVIRELTPGYYRELKQDGAIGGGMVPKLDNAFTALTAGVAEVVIGNLEAISSGRATVCKTVSN